MPAFSHRIAGRVGRLAAALREHAAAAPAITDGAGTSSYGRILARANDLRRRLIPHLSVERNHRVALFLQPQSNFVCALLATWGVNATAVPLSPLYPPAALSLLLEDAEPTVIVTESGTRTGLPDDAPGRVVIVDADPVGFRDPDAVEPSAEGLGTIPDEDDPAMILFTSGTTGRSKGVVWSHSMIDYQVSTLTDAWRWSSADRVLNVLPLHHVHGLVNVVLTSLYNGAHLEMHPSFSAAMVWAAICREECGGLKPPTVFMAVPAVYKKLIQYFDASSDVEQNAMKTAASNMRLFVCGSASLARRDFDAWTAISGQPLLERYGMTETGMTLSNSFDKREQGLLGYPLPGVEARLVDTDNDGDRGHLQVRGPGVFREYWHRPQETKKSFTEDGWFDTGDVVEKVTGRKCYRMIGRASADVIKTGGYKVSAIEVEEALRDCPGVADCCVVGVSDNVLGQRIVAAIISANGDSLIPILKQWASRRLPKYKVPREFLVVEDFPRNVLGKVQKQVLRARLE